MTIPSYQIDPIELEKIRNHITLPLVQYCARWKIRHLDATLEMKKAYVSGLHSVLSLVFPESEQTIHTMEALEKLLFN